MDIGYPHLQVIYVSAVKHVIICEWLSLLTSSRRPRRHRHISPTGKPKAYEAPHCQSGPLFTKKMQLQDHVSQTSLNLTRF
jgi:hypothetical protein